MEDQKETVKVEIRENGPLIIAGEVNLTDADGNSVIAQRVVICRCGQSGKMPYCDASHNRVGFSSK